MCTVVTCVISEERRLKDNAEKDKKAVEEVGLPLSVSVIFMLMDYHNRMEIFEIRTLLSYISIYDASRSQY